MQRVTIWEFPFGAAAADTGEILLPATVNPAALRHEVGHLVAHANDDELGRLFELSF